MIAGSAAARRRAGSPDCPVPPGPIAARGGRREYDAVTAPAPPHPDAPPPHAAPVGSGAPGGLAAEVRKRRPFDSPEEEAYLNVVRTADRLARRFDELFKARGLSQPLYNCLRILCGAEQAARSFPTEGCDRTAFHGLPIREIGDRLIAHAPDVTRLADRLEALGLAERRRCSADRRSVRVFPTAQGRAAVAELAGPVAALHGRLLGHLGPDRLAALSDLLTAARRGAG